MASLLGVRTFALLVKHSYTSIGFSYLYDTRHTVPSRNNINRSRVTLSIHKRQTIVHMYMRLKTDCIHTELSRACSSEFRMQVLQVGQKKNKGLLS